MPASSPRWFEFPSRWDGMRYALSGGLWLHRHVYKGEPMAHLVSSDRALLLKAGRLLRMRQEWLQYKPLKEPDTGIRIEAWHWDLVGDTLELGVRLAAKRQTSAAG